MNPDTSIRAAFVAALIALNGPEIAWENIAHTPTVGTPYLRPFLRPAEPFQAECGTLGMNRHSGYYQISLFYPSGQGLEAIHAMKDNLLNVFKRGTVLINGSLTIVKSYASAERQETDWLHLPITIEYRMNAPN